MESELGFSSRCLWGAERKRALGLMMEWMWTGLHADPQASESSANVGNWGAAGHVEGRSSGEDVPGGRYGGSCSGDGGGSWIQGPAQS